MKEEDCSFSVKDLMCFALVTLIDLQSKDFLTHHFSPFRFRRCIKQPRDRRLLLSRRRPQLFHHLGSGKQRRAAPRACGPPPFASRGGDDR